MGMKINMQMIKIVIQNYLKSVIGILIIKIGILEKIPYFLITRRDYRDKIQIWEVQACSTN